MPSSINGKNTTPDGQVTPQEQARVIKSVRGLEQAPSSRQQLGAFTNWRSLQKALGQPFNNERIPLQKLKLMRRDPMLAFGMHYQKMPKVKAPWYMDCVDPQVAAFMDGALRPIIASLIIAQEQKKDFGFQAIAKRFQLAVPQGTYLDPVSGEEKPAWDQTGGIQPVTLKPFVPLAPEGVEPMFDEATGEFAGIKYKPPQGSSPVGQKAKGAGGSSGEVEIDIFHSLWVTNEIESVFGNLFGYPRLGYAYPYWWSYWFRWAIADRAFEKKGDPPVVVRHPEGEIDLGNGETIPNQDYALLMAERLRAGAAIALPSNPYTNFEDRPGQIREWDIEYLKGGVEMDAFDSSFDYMDVMKLRSIFVPEQALIEGGGGCLLGSTPIKMPRDHRKHPDGVPLEDVRPGDLVWSFNEQVAKFELRPVKKTWLTMKDADVYKLTLDDGTSVTGTPDHPFMTRDGVWREMIELKPGDRLMPLYEKDGRRYYDGRIAFEDDFEPMVYLDPDQAIQSYEYREVSEELGWTGQGRAMNVHHGDEFHANTSPSNLEPLTPSEHARRHFEDEHWKAIFRDRVREAMANLDEETRAKLSNSPTEEQLELLRQTGKIAMDDFKASMSSDEWQQFCSERTKKGWANGRDMSSYVYSPKACKGCGDSFVPNHSRNDYCSDCVEPRREPFMGRIKRPQNYKPKSCEACGEEFKPRSGIQKRCDGCMVAVRNHKVVSIEKVGKADVWDIEIDGPEHCKNYVAGGVVVHNTSSRNVAEEMFEGMIEGQTMDMEEIVESVNRWIVPHLMMVNFPEQFAQGISCRMKVQGFSSTDTELLSQVIQLIGQEDPNKLGIDVRASLKQLGIPLLDQKAYEANLKAAAEQAAAQGPPEVAPTTGSAGVVPTNGKRPSTGANTGLTKTGGSFTGFTYVPPISLAIELSATSEAAGSFMADLPSSPHYEDATMRSFTKRLWNAMEKFYAQQYREFQQHVGEQEAIQLSDEELKDLKVQLSIDESEEEIDFAISDVAATIGRKVVNAWPGNLDLLDETSSAMTDILERMLTRASELTRKNAGLDKRMSDDAIKNWVSAHIADLIPKSLRSIREELSDFVGKSFEESEGEITPDELSKAVEAHFSDFPKWLSSRFSRAETRDAFNAATLLTGRDNGLDVAQAMDALSGNTDRHCFPADTEVVALDPEQGFSRWFEGDLIEIETADGNLLSTTPDHPILTRYGWVLAGDLNKGDQVVNSTIFDGVFEFASGKNSPDHDDMPPATEKKFDLLCVANTGSAVGETISASDLDCNGGYCNVDVVSPNGTLRDGLLAALDKEVDHFGLIGRIDLASGLLGDGNSFDLGARSFASSHRSIGLDSLSSFLLNREFGVHESSSLGVGSELDPCSSEGILDVGSGNSQLTTDFSRSETTLIERSSLRDVDRLCSGADLNTFTLQERGQRALADIEAGCELTNALAGQIKLDDVVAIRRKMFVGHVYNLQTKDRWYMANGIVTHNCEERDGQFFPIDQALLEEEHPGGTLAWRLVKEPVTLARVDEIPNAPAGTIGTFDAETNTILLSTSADREDERQFLLAIGESLS